MTAPRRYRVTVTWVGDGRRWTAYRDVVASSREAAALRATRLDWGEGPDEAPDEVTVVPLPDDPT